MKKLLLIAAGLLFMVAIQSCDRCKDVDCGVGGTCEDGECVCDAGFSGDNCETEDKCISQNVQCENDGVCEDGECDCEPYYRGDFCEDYCENGRYRSSTRECECYPGWEADGCTVESRAAWIGGYLYTTDCNTEGGSAMVDTLPHPDPDSAFAKNYVRVENLTGQGDVNGYGLINGDTLTIPRQSVKSDNGTSYRVESVEPVTLNSNNGFELVIDRLLPGVGSVTCTHVYTRL